MEIDAGQVLRLLMQFCQENGLSSSLTALQEETGVSLNLLDRPEAFTADCLAGRWDAVLAALAPLHLPASVLQQVYGVVILELVEAREVDAARAVLRGVLPMALLRSEDGDAYASLEALVSRGGGGAAAQLYGEAPMGQAGGGGSSGAAALLALQQQPCQARRAALARAVLAHTSTAPPSRLLTLLAQALKWQVHTGQLPAAAVLAGSPPDLFLGGLQARRIEDAQPCAGRAGGLLVPYGAGPLRPGAALITPNGACLVVGGGDGLIEVFDASGGFAEAASSSSSSSSSSSAPAAAPGAPRLSPLCPYQAMDEFMVHEAGITALAASGDGEMLASASADGVVKVWRLATGECLRSFSSSSAEGGAGGAPAPAPTTASVLALAFSRDGSLLVSGGLDGVARVWGLRSGKCVCEMRGHGAHITGVLLVLEDGAAGAAAARLVTGSADGSVRMWDARTGASLGVLLGDAGNSSGSGSGSSGGGSGSAMAAAGGLFAAPPVLALLALPSNSAAQAAHQGAFFVLRAPPPPTAPASAGRGGGAAGAAPEAAGAAPGPPPPPLLLLSAARSGAVLATYAPPPSAPAADAGAAFAAAAVSPTGKFVYAALGEGSRGICAWEVAGGAGVVVCSAAHERGVAGLVAHPTRPVLVSWGEEGVMKSWA